MKKIKNTFSASNNPFGARARDKKQVRSTLKANFKSTQGTFASFKNGFAQGYDSYLERRFLEMLEVNPKVVRYQTQPLKIDYWARGFIRHATPDVQVWTSNSSFIVEVKAEHQLAKAQTQIKVREVADAMRQLGYDYALVTEVEIDADPIRAFVDELVFWLWHPLPDGAVDVLEALAYHTPQFSLAELIIALGNNDEAHSHALMLLAQGHLDFNLEHGLHPELPLQLLSCV